MRTGLVVALVAATAITSGIGGYFGGYSLAENSIVAGGQYVTGLKAMPEKPKSYGPDTPPNPYDDARIDSWIFCSAMRKATGALPIGCEALFATETHGEPE